MYMIGPHRRGRGAAGSEPAALSFAAYVGRVKCFFRETAVRFDTSTMCCMVDSIRVRKTMVDTNDARTKRYAEREGLRVRQSWQCNHCMHRL
jgi:ubiquitin C-terminal hydrolase